MITIKNVDYACYGNCLEISNGNIVARVTTEVGPRIIYYGTTDGQNLMYIDEVDEYNRSSEFLDTNFKKGEMWHIYGGHRLWRNPEDEASYYPDNYPVEVSLLENGAIFKSEPEKTTGLQKSIKVTMSSNGELTVEHGFYNFTDSPIKCALWTISVFEKNGLAVFPLSKVDTGLLPNRNIVFWPYTNIKDDRINIEQEYVTVSQRADGTPFKIGMLNTEGVVYFVLGNKMVEKRFTPAKFDGKYADYSSNVECYGCDKYTEVEVISELSDIPAGESKTHTETWILHEQDEAVAKIKAWVNEK